MRVLPHQDAPRYQGPRNLAASGGGANHRFVRSESTDGTTLPGFVIRSESSLGYDRAPQSVQVSVTNGAAHTPRQCQYCGRAFSRSDRLHAHERTHTGEKPYVCKFEGCGKRFKENNARYKHMRTHSDRRPYECEGCDASFKLKHHLKRHALMVHSTEGESQSETTPPAAPMQQQSTKPGLKGPRSDSGISSDNASNSNTNSNNDGSSSIAGGNGSSLSGSNSNNSMSGSNSGGSNSGASPLGSMDDSASNVSGGSADNSNGSTRRSNGKKNRRRRRKRKSSSNGESAQSADSAGTNDDTQEAMECLDANGSANAPSGVSAYGGGGATGHANVRAPRRRHNGAHAQQQRGMVERRATSGRSDGVAASDGRTQQTDQQHVTRPHPHANAHAHQQPVAANQPLGGHFMRPQAHDVSFHASGLQAPNHGMSMQMQHQQQQQQQQQQHRSHVMMQQQARPQPPSQGAYSASSQPTMQPQPMLHRDPHSNQPRQWYPSGNASSGSSGSERTHGGGRRKRHHKK
eukprot:Opistho-2@96943